MKKIATYYLIGILTFSCFKIWAVDFQTYVYYLWESGKDVIVWTFFLFLCDKKNIHYAACILTISLYRFLLELVCTISGSNINNNITVNIIFSLCIFSIVYIWIKEMLLKKKK